VAPSLEMVMRLREEEQEFQKVDNSLRSELVTVLPFLLLNKDWSGRTNIQSLHKTRSIYESFPIRGVQTEIMIQMGLLLHSQIC
jgi:hypothetical protein